MLAPDAFTRIYAGTGTNPSGSHTPVGNPRAVIVIIGIATNSDLVSAVTYGGVAMTRAKFQGAAAGGPGDGAMGSYVYFLGANIPSGTQTVATTISGANNKYVSCTTYTAGGNTEVVQASSVVDTAQNPRGTLSLGGKVCACLMGGMTGAYNNLQFSPLTNWSETDVYDMGDDCGFTNTYNVYASVDVTTGYNQTAMMNSCWVQIAIAEMSSANPAAVSPYFRV